MKINHIALISLSLLLMIQTVSATDYYIKVEVQQIESISNDSITWSPSQKISLNKSDSKDIIGGMSINYNDLMQPDMVVSLKLTGGTTPDVLMTKTTSKCIKGNSQGTCTSVGHVKLTLSDIIALSTSGTSTTPVNSSNPFHAYYYMDKEISLKLDGTKTFDVALYLSQNDLSQDDAPEEVEVYFESAVPFGITVDGGSFEPKWSWSGNTVKYIIEESSTYTFTVKYEAVNPSGYKEQKTDIYKFITKGLKAANSNTVSSIAPYEVSVGANKEIRMSQPGKFTGQEGVTISANGAESFIFKFATEGQYHIKFTSDNNAETFVDFVVKSSSGASQTTQSSDTTTQQQAAGQVLPSTDGFNYIILIPIAVVVIGIILIKRKKQFSRPKIVPNKVQ